MKIASKKDGWLTLIVWGSMLFAIGSGVFSLLADTQNEAPALVILILSVILPLFLLWIWCTTFYILDEESLVIRYGPFSKTIPLQSIRSVKKTRNPLSSPALSLQRIEIAYGKYDFVLISPKDRDAFIEILARRCQASVGRGCTR